jgi:hypothetical protein
MLLLIALSACGWNHRAGGDDVQLQAPLWSPRSVVASDAGLYVPLPASGQLALVPLAGDAERVDIGEGRVDRLFASSDASTVAAGITRFVCDPDDPRDARGARLPADCPSDALQVQPSVAALDGAALGPELPLDAVYTALRWSSDGRFAVAWLDLADAEQVDGVVNLTSLRVMDAVAGTAATVSVGFAASQVLFTPDDARVVVLSQNQVAVVDLASAERIVNFALTLDPDQVVVPVGVDLTPDGRYALISVANAADLYVLDLETHSVNIVSLAASPSAMHVDRSSDRTVFVSNASASAEILDHANFALREVPLDEPCDTIVPGDGFAVLARVGGQDVYRLDLVTGDVVEFRLHGPLDSVHLAPTGELAVALTRSLDGGRPGMEVLDLRDDRGHSYPYLLEGLGIDVAFDESGPSLHALVLQDGIDYVYDLDLYASTAVEVDLEAPPIGIGAMPGGGFYVTNAVDLGMVTFFDPSTGESHAVTGFGTFGLADPIELTPVEAE